jgi:hypothetical protein
MKYSAGHLVFTLNLYIIIGRLFKDNGNEIVVKCIVDDDYYSIEKPALEVHPSCLGT